MPFDDDVKRANPTGSALEKSLAVLDVLARSDRPMGLPEIGAALDLPRQTVHRVTAQLESLALVRRLPGREGFLVGAKLLDLGLNALQAGMSMTPLRVILRELVDRVGETCNVGVLDRDEVVYIDRVECDWPLRLQYGPGSRLAPHATGIGKLLMAHLPARTRRRIIESGKLKKFTDNTIADPDALESQFKTIRKQGYAVNDQESVVGLMGLAVPITDPGGRVIAGLALHAPTARMSIADAVKHVPLFQETAGCLARVLDEVRDAGGSD
ncbi:MAG: IclR family transcriptional regulator [Rhodospirillaceae bacterium]